MCLERYIGFTSTPPSMLATRVATRVATRFGTRVIRHPCCSRDGVATYEPSELTHISPVCGAIPWCSKSTISVGVPFLCLSVF
jgi:hypothetical protein